MYKIRNNARAEKKAHIYEKIKSVNSIAALKNRTMFKSIVSSIASK